jgi:hypothetical protein
MTADLITLRRELAEWRAEALALRREIDAIRRQPRRATVCRRQERQSVDGLVTVQ